MKTGKLGVYVYPVAVVSAPDYAKRLVEEAGVDYFILRSGYGLDFPAPVGQAVEIVRGLKAGLCIMMGSFWGNAKIKVLDHLPSKSYESRYPMEMPGSGIDAEIVAKYEKACKQFHPDSVCLTHGRYRHPAYLDGLFDEGRDDADYLARMEAAGIPRAEMLAARKSWEQAMEKTDQETLLKFAERGMIEFLCELSQSDAFRRFVAFRCETVRQSLHKMRKAVVSHGVSFGTNAYSPTAAEVCGQDYNGAYSETCDFVQPLFPYMEYHHYEPIAAWGRYIAQHAKLDEPTAIEAAKRVFNLGGTVCPDRFSELDACGEGEGRSIRSIVGRELEMCVPYLDKPYKTQPVFRGIQWDCAATDGLMAEAKGLGFDSFVFMGSEYLSKGPSPSTDWF